MCSIFEVNPLIVAMVNSTLRNMFVTKFINFSISSHSSFSYLISSTSQLDFCNHQLFRRPVCLLLTVWAAGAGATRRTTAFIIYTFSCMVSDLLLSFVLFRFSISHSSRLEYYCNRSSYESSIFISESTSLSDFRSIFVHFRLNNLEVGELKTFHIIVSESRPTFWCICLLLRVSKVIEESISYAVFDSFFLKILM